MTRKVSIQSKTIVLSLGLILLLSWSVKARQEVPAALKNPPTNIQSKTLSNKYQLTDIHDIKPLESIGVNPALFWYVALGALFLALLAVFYVYWTKRKKKKIPELVATISPQEAAFNRLDALPPLMDSDGKRFYFELSMILRAYIEQRFNVGAPEMTTEELLACIPELEIDSGLIRGVRAFVYDSDPVKFAKQAAEVEKMKHHLEFVKNLVKMTTPLPVNSADELNPKLATRNLQPETRNPQLKS